MHIKVIEVIPLIVFFFPLFTPESLLYYSFILFYLTLSIIYFTSFYYYKFNFFFSFSSSLFFIFNFPRAWHDCFEVCRSLFSPFIFLSSFLLFYLLTPHPLILILTLFWGWHSCSTVCQSLNTYSFYFSTNIFYLILSLLEFQ